MTRIMIQTGNGRPSSVPYQTVPSASGSGPMVSPSLAKKATPRSADSRPSVVMKVGMAQNTRSSPTEQPISAAMQTTARKASGIGTPARTTRIANSVPDRPTVAPTERSISPAMITMVMPTAMMATTEVCCSSVTKFSVLKKFGAVNEKMTQSRTSAMATPISARHVLRSIRRDGRVAVACPVMEALIPVSSIKAT